MKLPFPSEEWAKQLQVELNQSQDYAEAAATWEGDFYFIVDPGQGVVKEEVMYLDPVSYTHLTLPTSDLV